MIRGGGTRGRGEEKEKKRERGGVGAQGLLLAIYGPAWPDTEDSRGKGKNGEREPRDGSEDNGWRRGAAKGENKKDQRGQERNGYHRQAILVAPQTGKTTRISVSETRSLLAEDEFRSFCSARDSFVDRDVFARRIPPAFWSSLATEFREVDAKTRFSFALISRNLADQFQL